MTQRVSEKERPEASLASELEAHRAWLHRFALRLAGSPADAEDLVQEAFLLALRSAESFRGGSALRTWLYRIALNVHLDATRRSRRDNRARAVKGEGLGHVPEPIVSATASEARARVARAIGRLPDMQRMCLVLRVYEELSYEDIASIVGSSREAVKLNLVYARRKLAEWLRDD